MWDNGTGTDYAWNHKDISEVCPPGYHRPNDGYTNQIAYNGPYPNFERTLPLPVERSTHDGDPASNSNDQMYSEMKRYLMSSIPQNVSDGKFIVTQLLQAFVRMVRMRI